MTVRDEAGATQTLLAGQHRWSAAQPLMLDGALTVHIDRLPETAPLLHIRKEDIDPLNLLLITEAPTGPEAILINELAPAWDSGTVLLVNRSERTIEVFLERERFHVASRQHSLAAPPLLQGAGLPVKITYTDTDGSTNILLATRWRFHQNKRILVVASGAEDEVRLFLTADNPQTTK